MAKLFVLFSLLLAVGLAPAVKAATKPVTPQAYTSGNSTQFYSRLAFFGLTAGNVSNFNASLYNPVGIYPQVVPVSTGAIPYSLIWNRPLEIDTDGLTQYYGLDPPGSTIYIPVANLKADPITYASSVYILLPAGTRALAFQFATTPDNNDDKDFTRVTFKIQSASGLSRSFTAPFTFDVQTNFYGFLTTSSALLDSLAVLYVSVQGGHGYTTSGLTFIQFQLA
jgi:hypothetical protein